MAKFSLSNEQSGDLRIIHTHGYIDANAGEMILSEMKSFFAKGERKFLFNLKDTEIINSAGVSKFIDIIKVSMEDDGTIAFCDLIDIIETTFDIMGLVDYADIYKTQDEAVKAMS